MIHQDTTPIWRRCAALTTLLVALSVGASVSVGNGEALAQNLAHCQFQAHVSFAYNGAQPGEANCNGMLNGGLVDPAGTFTVLEASAFVGTVGPYGWVPGALDSSEIRFEAHFRRPIDLSAPGVYPVSLNGHMQLHRTGSLLTVSGDGYMIQHGVKYSGTGRFARDNGPPQAENESGELTLSVTITDNSSSPPLDPAVQCKVPKLRGKTIAHARTALRNAHCELGTVKKPKGKHQRLVVLSQSIRANKTKPAGTNVNVTLGKTKHQKRHR